MRVDYKKIIPYVEYLTQKISYLMSDDTAETVLPDTDGNKET